MFSSEFGALSSKLEPTLDCPMSISPADGVSSVADILSTSLRVGTVETAWTFVASDESDNPALLPELEHNLHAMRSNERMVEQLARIAERLRREEQPAEMVANAMRVLGLALRERNRILKSVDILANAIRLLSCTVSDRRAATICRAECTAELAFSLMNIKRSELTAALRGPDSALRSVVEAPIVKVWDDFIKMGAIMQHRFNEETVINAFANGVVSKGIEDFKSNMSELGVSAEQLKEIPALASLFNVLACSMLKAEKPLDASYLLHYVMERRAISGESISLPAPPHVIDTCMLTANAMYLKACMMLETVQFQMSLPESERNTEMCERLQMQAVRILEWTESSLKSTIKLSQDSYGENSPHTIEAGVMMANLCLITGRPRQALRLLKRKLAWHEFDPKDPETGTALNELIHHAQELIATTESDEVVQEISVAEAAEQMYAMVAEEIARAAEEGEEGEDGEEVA